MKRLFTIISVVFMSLLAVSCYDDSALWESVNEHEQRIKTLEDKCKELNTNIQSLQDLIEASVNGDAITSVTVLKEGGVEVGYTLTFASGKTINIYHGEDGEAGKTPQIGAAAEDGILYWTLDGKWILDAEGNKIPVSGEDGVTPILKVEGATWYVSYDEGATWVEVATIEQPALFESITFDEEYVYITLTSGEALVLDRASSFDIVFNTNEVAFFPGEECIVEYELIGADEYAQVKAFGPEGWMVYVEEGEDNTKGYIKVTSALEFADGKVTVLVTDGRSKTFLRTLDFKTGKLVSSVNTYNVDADVTSLDITFSTNFKYQIATDVDWITLADDTKSEMRDETISLALTQNTTHEQRLGYVYIVSMNGYIIHTFAVYQFGIPYDAWYIVGGFNDWTCGDENYKMVREDDMFVYKNFETTGTELKFNIGTWDVERTGRFSAVDYGSILLPYGDNLDLPAGTYDIYMDKNAFTVYFMTEGKTPADAEETFVLEDGKYWIVAGGQWSGFEQVVATPLTEDAKYGYLPIVTAEMNDWGGLSSSMANAFEFKAQAEGGYTIKDSYGRYLYQIAKYNSYNVSTELPDSGYVWNLKMNKYGYMQITNADTDKTMFLDLVYNTFGCYAEGNDARYYPYLVLAEEAAVEEEPTGDVWGVVGTHNSWAAPDTEMVEVDGMYVAYNVVFDQEVNKFKIRANNEWNDAANYGLAVAAEVKPDHYYTLVSGGSSGDMTVPAGTYDIWFDLANTTVYVMTPGKSISEAVDGSADMPVPGDNWYLVGTFNSWTVGDATYAMTETDGWYVYPNFTADETTEIKFNAGDWTLNRGGVFVAVDEPIAAVQGGDNIIPAAGTYDIYMDKDANVIYFMTPGSKPGEIKGMDAKAIWEGSFDNSGWSGNQDLAWGGYGWSTCKPGDVLRIYGNPTEDAFTNGWWCLSLRVGTDWANLNGVPTQYDNPYVVSVILTQEIIDHLISGNGLVLTGDGFVVSKVVIYKEHVETAAAEGNYLLVESSDLVENPWDTQFWIKVGTKFAEGDKWEITMNVKADEAAYASTQTHEGTGGYLHYEAIGTVNFTTEWTSYVASGTVSSAMVGGDAISFQLNTYEYANKYYFDNISFRLNGVEQIVNGTFDDPYTNENFWMQQYGKNDGGIVPATIVNTNASDLGYALTMTNAEAQENNWAVQCWYKLDEPLKANTTYELKCVAKATAAYDWCSIFLQSSTTDSQNYNHGMSFPTAWTEKVVTITTDDVDSYDKLTFNLGDFAGVLSIDNISLKEVGSDVELIKNGDFEDGTTTGWASWSNVQSLGEGY